MGLDQKNPKQRKKQLNDYGRYVTLGIQMAAAILILTWLGRKGDAFFNLKQPWLTIAGAISGIAAGMYWLFNSMPRSDKK